MRFQQVQYIVLTAAACALSVIGCVRQQSDQTAIAPQPSTTADNNGVGVAAAAYTDANIVALLDEANVADSTAAAFAMSKLTNEDVKDFAKQMMKDHHELREEDQEMVGKRHIMPDAPSYDPVQPAAQQEMATLQVAPVGPGFDLTYLDQEMQAHQAVIRLANQMLASAQDHELKEMLNDTMSKLREHWEKAQKLQQKLMQS